MKAIKKPSRKPAPEPERDEHPILHFFGAIRSAYASPASDVSEQRKKLMAALSATADLIDLTDFGGENPGTQSAAELRALVVALEDLERGVQSPLLRPSNIEGRRPDAAGVWMMRADVVIAAELFSAGGMTLNAIARNFASKYPKLKLLVRKNTKLETCIKGWRLTLLKKSDALARAENIAPFPTGVATHFKASMAVAAHLAGDEAKSKATGTAIISRVSRNARATN